MTQTFFLLVLLLLLPGGQALALEASENPLFAPLQPGEMFPDLALEGVLPEGQLSRLGLSGPGPHVLSGVGARVVVLEAFSMYCPHCQNEAPVMNELHALLKKKGLDRKVAIIGVGVGNSDFEVQVFRDKYAVPFPLFSDPDMKANRLMGEVGTPFFYVLVRQPDSGQFRIAQTHLGRVKSAAWFLDQIEKLCARAKEVGK